MQVSVEEVSNSERRLTITVPANLIEESYQKEIHQLAKKANIKGFRPGKAPLSYIKERFGDEARRDALNEVIKQSLLEALSAKELTPINNPRIELKKIEPDLPLEFVVHFEVLPPIGEVQFKLANVEKTTVEIKQEEDVTRVIEHLRKQHANWRLVSRPAQETDRVVLDYHAVYEGKPDMENKVEGFPLELGSKTMISGFEEGLIGTSAGEEKTLHLTFPADFNVQEKAGKSVDFIVNIKQVFEADIPELNEQFMQKLGILSGKQEDLAAQILRSLEQEGDRLVKGKLKEQVFSALLAANAVEPPASLVEQEAKKIHDEMYPAHRQHDHHQHSDHELSTFNEVAKKRVILGLLIAEYIKQSQLVIDNERVGKRIEEIASAYEKPAEVIKWLSSNDQRKDIEAQVMEDQVIDKLLEGIPETIKIMSYAELKGIRI